MRLTTRLFVCGLLGAAIGATAGVSVLALGVWGWIRFSAQYGADSAAASRSVLTQMLDVGLVPWVAAAGGLWGLAEVVSD